MPSLTPTRKPNIVLVIMDDLAWGDLSCHGNPHTNTPHLDAMHARSARFTQYCSGALCTPARASVMTGRYPYRTRAIDTFIGRAMIDPGEITLAQLLKEQGYATCISGKWHLGDCYPMRPIDMGFDEALIHQSGGLGQPGNVGCYSGESGYFDPILMHNGNPEASTGYCTDIFTEHAIQFMADHKDEPFFCYVATNAPHVPLIVDEKWSAKHQNKVPDKTAKLYGMVENIDYNMGRIFTQLEALGLSNDTIVIYTSDHGPCPGAQTNGKNRWNAGLRGIKGEPYEGGVKVPHFWSWPGRFKPSDVDRPANPIDILPTLVNIAGGQLPRDRVIDGKDLGPLLQGDSAEQWPDRFVFLQWHRGNTPIEYRNCLVRRGHWKLVDGRELYDLQADPAEQHNVAADHPQRVAEFRAAYEKWFDDVSHTRADNYAPPRIVIGHDAEPTTLLTRQDARISNEDGWGDGNLGQWHVEIHKDLRCSVEVTFAPQQSDAQVVLQLPGQGYSCTAQADATRVMFKDVEFQQGLGQMAAWLQVDGRQFMVREVICYTQGVIDLQAV